MKKIYIITILFIVMLLSLSLSIAEGQYKTDTIYRSGINNYGFYRVFNVTLNGPAPYKNHTLNINVGDTVIWTNDIDDKTTIVSRQGLWDKTKGELKWMYKQFIYTFNRSGTYTFYIKERSKQEQKIIVAAKKTPTVKIVPKPTLTKVPKAKIVPKPTLTVPKPTTKSPINMKTKTLTTTKDVQKNKDLDIVEELLIPKDLKNRSSSFRTYKNMPGFDIWSIIVVILIICLFNKRKIDKNKK